jgi:hypothetical protein
MYQYCLQRMGWSEDEAYKRIRLARLGREYPSIFEALAAGRLHMAGLLALASHLQPGTAEELLREAEHKSREQIEALLAARFPRPALPTLVRPLSTEGAGTPGTHGASVTADVIESLCQLAPGELA